MGSALKAMPLSRNDIRKMVGKLRALVGKKNDLYIDVIALLERMMYILDPEFSFDIVADYELREMAVTYPDKHLIVIKESVYHGAIRGNGRDRFTIMHEISHYILHDKSSISFARGSMIKTYEDPEWQANAFAGEFLMPSHLICKMTVDDIVLRCGVSRQAANYQLNTIRNR